MSLTTELPRNLTLYQYFGYEIVGHATGCGRPRNLGPVPPVQTGSRSQLTRFDPGLTSPWHDRGPNDRRHLVARLQQHRTIGSAPRRRTGLAGRARSHSHPCARRAPARGPARRRFALGRVVRTVFDPNRSGRRTAESHGVGRRRCERLPAVLQNDLGARRCHRRRGDGSADRPPELLSRAHYGVS